MKIRVRRMRKQEAEKWISKEIEDLRNDIRGGSRLSDSWLSGYSVACMDFLRWLVDQGVIKE